MHAPVHICCTDSFLQYEYFNAVLINEVDEMGNNVELGGEFLLEPNDHYNNLSVNLSLSVVQVPTNMYNKGESARFTCGIWLLGGNERGGEEEGGKSEVRGEMKQLKSYRCHRLGEVELGSITLQMLK